jgi:hypothetical protein
MITFIINPFSAVLIVQGSIIILSEQADCPMSEPEYYSDTSENSFTTKLHKNVTFCSATDHSWNSASYPNMMMRSSVICDDELMEKWAV